MNKLLKQEETPSTKKKWEAPRIETLNINKDTSWFVWLFGKEIGDGPPS